MKPHAPILTEDWQLTPGPVWPSFETLRSKHGEKFALIQPGMVATLHVKRRTFRLMNEADYLQLTARAAAAHALAVQVQDVALAVQAYQQNPSDAGLLLITRLVQRLTALRDQLLTPEAPHE